MANKDNACPIKSIRDDIAGCCCASNIKFIIFKTNVIQKWHTTSIRVSCTSLSNDVSMFKSFTKFRCGIDRIEININMIKIQESTA